MNHRENNRCHNRAICAAGGVWLALAAVLPLYEAWAVVLTLVAMAATYFLVKRRAIK